jgi:hypothetical protein
MPRGCYGNYRLRTSDLEEVHRRALDLAGHGGSGLGPQTARRAVQGRGCGRNLSRVGVRIVGRRSLDSEDPTYYLNVRVTPAGELSDGQDWIQGYGEAIGDHLQTGRWFRRIVSELHSLGVIEVPPTH